MDKYMVDERLIGGCESLNGDLFSRMMKIFSSEIGKNKTLKATHMDTPLGAMVAVADEETLYLLEFVDGVEVQKELEQIQQETESAIILGRTQPIDSMEKELHQYFSGRLTEFKTPLYLIGTSFQKSVWKALKKIPFGETRSYAEISIAIGHAKAFRAAAQANKANPFAIVIPCHRVINSNGELGGYASGILRKKWLLEHEQAACSSGGSTIENSG